MTPKTFCGQCGTENPKKSNFCHKCGHKLIHTAGLTDVHEPEFSSNSDDYPDIKEALQSLVNSNGFIIVSIGDYYVQFANDLTKRELYFEAVSNVFIPSIGNKDKEFKQLGLSIDPNTNYFKYISHGDFSVNEIVEEIKTVFEKIYHINLSSYKIETDFDDVPLTQTVQTTHTTSSANNQNWNKNYGCIAIIVIAIIVGIFSLNIDNKFTTPSGDTIETSSLVGKNVFDVRHLYSPTNYETLTGTNNYRWVVYFKDINVTVESEKSTNIIYKATKGRKPRKDVWDGM